MYPILFKFGPVIIYSYGFFLAFAYLAATYVFWKEAKKQGYQEEKLLDFSVVSLVAAIVGGRIFYILINSQYFFDSGNFKKIFFFWEGGFAYYGSFILVLFFGTYLIRKWKWSFLQIADIASLAVLLATFFGKIGSFLSGNDFGSLTKLPWDVTFPLLEGKRHPVQLYEALVALALLIALYIYYKKNTTRAYKLKSGAVFFYFLFFSSVSRLILEQFRGDSTYLGPVKIAQVFAFVIALFALFSLYYFQFRNFSTDRSRVSHYLLGISSKLKVPLRKKIR